MFFKTYHSLSTAPDANISATASGLAAGGVLSLSSVSLAMWILKRLRRRGNKFELSRSEEHQSFSTHFLLFVRLAGTHVLNFLHSNSDIEIPPQVYRNSIDGLL